MKRFVTRTVLFAALASGLLAVALFLLPNPGVQNNMLGALIDKHKLLEDSSSSRIIFIGGSNVAFGLDSKRMQDAFHTPVVNAGVHASIGMKYYLTDLKPYIQKGDLVVVIPEYSQLYTDSFYGNIELVSIIYDVFKEGKKYIDLNQWLHLTQFIPFYAATKMKFNRSMNASAPVGVYDRKAFNQFGDAYIHWDLPRKYVESAKPPRKEDHVNPEAIELLKSFQEYVHDRHAKMIMLPPSYQASSFDAQKPLIDQIYATLKKAGLPIVADPYRYRFADSLFYDTSYHLIRGGVVLRSSKIIEDIRMAGENKL